MKCFIFIICAALLFVSLTGCTGSRPTFRSDGKSPRKIKTFAQTLTAELKSLADKPFYMTVAAQTGKARLEDDHSLVETTYDAFGNKTESRLFYNNALLKMVVLQTSADGQKQAFVYGQNGEVKTAPQQSLNNILVSAAGAIAESVEIFEKRVEDVMLAQLRIPESAPPENFSVLDFSSPMIEEASPTAEAETTGAAIETPKEYSADEIAEQKKTEDRKAEDSALKLRAVVQSLKAVRVKNRTEDLAVKTN